MTPIDDGEGVTTGSASPRRRALPEWADPLAVAVVVLLSFVPYVAALGFYSDDWSFLEYARFAKAQSVIGVATEFRQYNRMRPVGDLTRAAQLRWFGEHPRGYHIVNSAFVLLVALLYWKVLRMIGFRRELVLATACAFAVMPHYSTLRFWFSSGVAGISLALALASIACDLRALDTRGMRRAWLRAASLLCIAASLLSYELPFPLLAIVAIAAPLITRKVSPAHAWRDILWGNILLLAGLFLFKASITDRLGSTSRLDAVVTALGALARLTYGPGDSGLNALEAVRISFVTYGVALPVNAVRIVLREPDGMVFVTAALCALVTWSSLRLVAWSDESRSGWSDVAAIRFGLVGLLLGYAIFLTNGNIQVSPTGTGNRTAGVAALGVALTIMGSLFLALRNMGRSSRGLIPAVSAVMVLLFALVTGTLSTFWRDSYRDQMDVLSKLEQDVPALPRGANILLDGVCMYRGPAPIFEAPWDLQSALRLKYNDPQIRADIVNQSLQVRPDGVHTAEYDSPTSYPFENLMVYDSTSRRTYRLDDYAAAEAYFREKHPHDLSNGCPRGFGGWGVEVF